MSIDQIVISISKLKEPVIDKAKQSVLVRSILNLRNSKITWNMSELIVSDLIVYPLKSARGIHVESIQLNELGPELDRRWMVIDSQANFVTQRKTPKMCLIETAMTADGSLELSVKGMKVLTVSAGGYTLRQSSVWGTEVQGEDCGDEAAVWISTYLDKQCRIIYMPSTHGRLVDTNYATQKERVGFADGFPLLVATQSSLEDFISKLGFEIGMDRFRPNIVINGNQPWAEDSWKKLAINDITLSLLKPCSRCIMPSINPQTAEKQMTVNQTLQAHRRRERDTYFGQNAVYDRLGSITLGDSVKLCGKTNF